MKKTVLFFAFGLLALSGFAQSAKYDAAMQAQIAKLATAHTDNSYPALANSFERIGDAEKTQWLPYYYAAYATVMGAFMEKDPSKVDAVADKAETLINNAESLAGSPNSELYVVKSMIATAHLQVDPQSRWQQYGQVSAENIAKAKQADPTNPRPVYLEAQSSFFTPEAFGGGKKVAKPIFEKALAMFPAFKPAGALYPTWGKEATEYFLSQCQ